VVAKRLVGVFKDRNSIFFTAGRDKVGCGVATARLCTLGAGPEKGVYGWLHFCALKSSYGEGCT
jgi:hypothetical protein